MRHLIRRFFCSGGTLPGASYDVVYQDKDLVVVVKSAGLLTVPGVRDKDDSLVTRLGPPFKAVHRLDRDTSGLLVVPRTQHAHRGLSIAFERRQVRKKYHARCLGILEGSGSIKAPIGKNTAIYDGPPRLWTVVPNGKHALTKYKVLSTTQRSTFLELTPVTGRSHQLRIHLAHIGAPILGDALHGDDPVAQQAADRLCLHATGLQFTHPRSGRRLSFKSEPDFDDLVHPDFLL